MKRRGTPNTRSDRTREKETPMHSCKRTSCEPCLDMFRSHAKVVLATCSSAPEPHDQRHQTKRQMKPPAASVVPGGQPSGSVESSHHHNSKKKDVVLQGHPTVCPVCGQHLLERGSKETKSFFSKKNHITLHYMIFHDILLLVAGSHSCSSHMSRLFKQITTLEMSELPHPDVNPNRCKI